MPEELLRTQTGLLRDQLNGLRDDVEKSTASRERLNLIIKCFTVIGLVLWVTTITLLVTVQHMKTDLNQARQENLTNTRLGKELLQQSCFAYNERTSKTSPLCDTSEFVTPRGAPKP